MGSTCWHGSPSDVVVVTLRLLFVSSTTKGGSGRSQRELARKLIERGYELCFLVDDGRPAPTLRRVYGQLSDISARLQGHSGGRLARWLEGLPGRRAHSVMIEGQATLVSPVPQNALATVLRSVHPDVVIINSMERWAWKRVYDRCHVQGVPTVLYVRETDSLDHMASGAKPTRLVANAESLVDELRSRGFECSFVPSVIDVGVTRTESTRQVALAINPVLTRGGDIVFAVAARLPEIQFVVQESWPLAADELAQVERRVAMLPNVTFRRSAPPGPQLYGDARVLLAPYRVDNRPRVIAEAQANGIPVVAADVPALTEAIGEGGITVEGEDINAWCNVLRSLWEDSGKYAALASAAAANSRRPEIDPDQVTNSFEEVLRQAVAIDAK